MWIRIYKSLCFKHHNSIFLFMKRYSASKLVPTNNVTHLVSFAAVFRLVTQRSLEMKRCVTSPKTAAKETMTHSPLLKKRRKQGRVTFAKASGAVSRDTGKNEPIADRLVPSNDPRNTCGTYFGSRSLPAFKVTNSFLIQPFSFGF